MFIFSANVIRSKIIKEIKILKRYPLQLFYELLLPFVKACPAILLGKYLIDSNGVASFSQTTGTENSMLFLGLSILFTIFIDIQEQVGFYLEREMLMGTLEQLCLTPVKKIGLIGGWITYAAIKAVTYGFVACLLLVIFTSNGIRMISLLLPTTYVYDLLRHSILNTFTIFELWIELLVLTVMILIHMFVAIKLFDSLVKRLEKWGTIYLK